MFCRVHPFLHESIHFPEFTPGPSQWLSALSMGLSFWNAFHWLLPMWGYSFMCWWYIQSTGWVLLLVPVAGQWVCVAFLRTQPDLFCGWCGSSHLRVDSRRAFQFCSLQLICSCVLQLGWTEMSYAWLPKVCFLYVPHCVQGVRHGHWRCLTGSVILQTSVLSCDFCDQRCWKLICVKIALIHSPITMACPRHSACSLGFCFH